MGKLRVVSLLQRPAPGVEVAVTAPGDAAIEEVRAIIRQNCGYEGHIRLSFGPLVLLATGLDARVTLIDDDSLDEDAIRGQINRTQVTLRIGESLYLAYLEGPARVEG